MARLSRIWFALFCTLILFSIGAWGQGSPAVYVSGTTAGGISRIISVNTSTGAVKTLVSNEGAAYEGLVVGPDNADNPSPAFLLYACDPSNDKIIRFDPTASEPVVEIVYAAGETGPLHRPQCGRFTSTGDLIVTSRVAGSGIWEIAGVANIALGAGGFPAPVQNPPNGVLPANSTTQVSQGIAQKNIGDLLIVDNANGVIVRSAYGPPPHFNGTPTAFISSGLASPFGIARKSNGEIYISNQGNNTVLHFNADGSAATTCPSVSFDLTSFGVGATLSTLSFMQMAPDDTLYIAASVSQSDPTGAVFGLNAADNSCPSAKPIATTGSGLRSLSPPVGIALPFPQTSVSQNATFSGNHLFNFGYAAVEVTGAVGPSCSLSVKATPTTPAALAALIAPLEGSGNPLPFGATPAVNLAWDGFEIALDTSLPPEGSLSPCLSSDGLFHFNTAAQLDTGTVVNPQIIACEDSSCILVTTTGVYPGGVLPSDGTLGGCKPRLSHVFLVNANPNSSEPGNFCGYDPPLINTQNPGKAPTFNSNSRLPVKSLLAAIPGTCKHGPYITDATALISVAQIADANGNPVFIPFIPLSRLISPIDGFHHYHLNLDLASCCAAPGTYMLTTDFLTGNTLTLYTTQTVVFKTQ